MSVPLRNCELFEVEFKIEFCLETFIAFGSISIPTTLFAPNLIEAIESIPDPHPMSTTFIPVFIFDSNNCRHILVVG